jgi:hypothetical protein
LGFTLVGYDETQTAAAMTNIAALQDQHVTVAGDDIYVPAYKHLMGAIIMGATCQTARITSPSLRCTMPFDIEPIEYGATPSTRPAFHDWFETPTPLDVNEALNFQCRNGAAEHEWAGVWLGSGPITEQKGHIFPVRTTGTTTVTADAWSLVPLTFPNTLPAARYQIVGAKFHSTTCELGRLVIPGYCWRPGAVGTNTVLEGGDCRFRYGRAGVWGEFDSRQPPQAEFLCSAADSSQTVMLDLIRL